MLAVVAALRPETVRVYSSQTRTALHVGVPVACEEGLATRYGPPVKVSGPLTSVSVPLGGVVAAKHNIARKRPAEQRVRADKVRGLKMPDWEAGFFRMVLLIAW